jgi:hypothetical protein
MFRYKVRKPRAPAVPKGTYPVPLVEKEVLTFLVQGKKATDIECRLSIALEKKGISYQFQTSYIAGMSLPGEIRLDFLVFHEGLYFPVQTQGEYAHASATQKARDRDRDAVLNWRLKGLCQNVTRVPSDELRYDLQDQQSADDFVQEYFR